MRFAGLKSLATACFAGVMVIAAGAAFASDEKSSCAAATKNSLDNHLTEEKLIWSQEGGQVTHVKAKPIYLEHADKCFLTIEFAVVKPKELMRTYYLVDAFENRIYAAWLGEIRRDQKNKGEEPLNCTYGIAYDEKTQCGSRAELDQFVRTLISQN
jgi:hypothetical protein